MKPNFVLPQTKLCLVVSYRNGVKTETLMETPPNNDMLFYRMLVNHGIGYSEIRAVKEINAAQLANSMTRWA